MTLEGREAWRRDPGLPFQRLDDDTIVVDPARREMHLLNETAARIWELLEWPHTLDQLVTALAEEYEAPEDELRAAAADLIAELGAKGVFVRA
jgi:hypothetical protein